jgi:UDP-GlcNAc:undecaprenyl-phosphate GlcNAc-1-phosphate transferase
MQISVGLLFFLTVPLFFSIILTPILGSLARALRILDIPGGRKLHSRPMPLLGGLAISGSFGLFFLLAIGIGTLLLDVGWVQRFVPQELLNMVESVGTIPIRVLAVSSGAVLTILIGLIDDIKGLSIRARFITEFFIATIVILIGLRPEIPFLPSPLDQIIAVIWIVGITNAFNLLDGADGLAAGVALITSLVLAWISMLANQPMVVILMLVLAGSIAGFLPYNLRPARIFMGSAGSLFLGYTLSVAVLLCTYTLQEQTIFLVLVPIFVMGIPIYDTTSVVITRLAKGRSIVIADRGHLVHRLLARGFGQGVAVGIIWLVTFCLGINSALLLVSEPYQNLIVVIQLIGIFLLFLLLERAKV